MHAHPRLAASHRHMAEVHWRTIMIVRPIVATINLTIRGGSDSWLIVQLLGTCLIVGLIVGPDSSPVAEEGMGGTICHRLKNKMGELTVQ